MTTALTPTQHVAQWRELGITDPAVILRLLLKNVTVETYGDFFEVGVTDPAQVIKLNARGISPRLVSQYQAEAAVSVDEVIELHQNKVVPGMLKALLAQSPGTSVSAAIATRKAGINKALLAVLTKLGITDAERMTALGKKFTATELKSWMQRGAVASDFFGSDGTTVVVPDREVVILRMLERPEMNGVINVRSMEPGDVRSKIDFYDAVRPNFGSDAEAGEFTNKWFSTYRPVTPEQALVMERHGMRTYDSEQILGFAQLVGYPLDDVAEALAQSPGLRATVMARRGFDCLKDGTNDQLDLFAELRKDLKTTARWMAGITTSSPVLVGTGRESHIYDGLTQVQAINWQLSVLASIPEGVDDGMMGRWESHYYRRVMSRTVHADAAAVRHQIATRISAGVDPDTYEALLGIGVPHDEMLDIYRRSRTVEFAGLPKVFDDKDETPSRPVFDWD